MRLSRTGAEVIAGEPIAALTNLAIEIAAPGGETIEGTLYAKACEGGARFVVRFTAVPPSVAAFLFAKVVD